MARDYRRALDLLLESKHKNKISNTGNIRSEASNEGHIQDAKSGWEWSPTSNGKPRWNGTGGMKESLKLMGYTDQHLMQLRIVHVAGTKGKGGTCAFVYAFLEAHGQRTGFPRKIGLYTSPQLISHRERIQINRRLIPEELFTKYFFEVWDVVIKAAIDNGYRRLGFFQFFVLLSVHIFIKEGVDAAIYETHCGGEYDPTNVLLPTVTGITTLGIDHVTILGPKIQNIAWQKAGIFTFGAAAFSSSQVPAAAQVLQERADERGVQLKFCDINNALPVFARALEPEVQRINASLALELTNALLHANADHLLTPEDIVRGIEQYFWPGRFQHIAKNDEDLFLDIGHISLSATVATKWFARSALAGQQTGPKPWRVLIFGHKLSRDGTAVLSSIAEALRESGIQVDRVIFPVIGEGRENLTSSNIISASQEEKWLKIRQAYVDAWKQFDPNAEILISTSISSALDSTKCVNNRASRTQVFIIGSIGLVGPALNILEPSLILPAGSRIDAV